jgi:galactosylceramidase
MKILTFFSLLIGFVFLTACSPSSTPTEITLNKEDTGRIFEGIGGVSAGASSELLIDYAEPYRSDILDYLFKPNFGAALHLLKVEIGADKVVVGSEPSHARNLAELYNPQPAYYQRGYEFWLMNEARKRNPATILGALEWTIPAYLENQWTQKNADYIVQFIKGAKDYWDLDLDFISPGKNESSISSDWLKNVFKPTLEQAGFEDIKILAPDDLGYYWEFCEEILQDEALKDIVDAVGYHYVCGHLPTMDNEIGAATENAINSGVSLWASEDWSMHDPSWENAHILPGIFNKMYIRDRITCLQIWCPFDGYYDHTGEWASTGLMKADQPWSGYYEVSPAIWAAAHIGQFVQPGWRFMDAACGYFNGPTGGNFVSLYGPATGDYSIIIFTDSLPQSLSVLPQQGMSEEDLHVWHSTEQELFAYRGTAQKQDGKFILDLAPNSIYSLTTTTGQQKGIASAPIPEPAPFPLPFTENFEDIDINQNPRFFADIDGSFEVLQDNQTGNKFLQQVIEEEPLEWTFFYAYIPFSGPLTTFGDTSWTDVQLSADVQIPEGGFASVSTRVMKTGTYPSGYSLKLYQSGNWELIQGSQRILGSGRIDASSSAWHNIALSTVGETIEASINGEKVKVVRDKTFKSGMVSIGANWGKVRFDNLEVKQ